MSRNVPVTTAIGCAFLLLGGCGGGGSKNAAPTANDVALATSEDVAIGGAFNAADGDGDGLSYSIVTAPSRGAVQFVAGNTFTYTPAADANGADEFTYRASDGRASSAIATVRIQIAAVNDAPRVRATLAATEDQPLSTQVVSDPEGDALTVTVISQPTHGRLEIENERTGQLAYTPDANYHGADAFSVESSDGQASVAATTVNLSVQAVNDAPVVAGETAKTQQGRAISVAVLANDSDVDGDSLTVSISTAPARGTAVVNGAKIDFEPGAFIGSTQLTYTVSDGNGASGTGVLMLESALRTPVAYLAREGTHPSFSFSLHYADGVRSTRIQTTHPAAATARDLQAAKNAPYVCYLATVNSATDLYCANLAALSPAIRMSAAATVPGDGVGNYAISEDGRRILYSDRAGLWSVDTAQPGSEQSVGTVNAGWLATSDLSRVVYSDLRYTPMQQPSQVYSLDVATSVATPLSFIAQPPDMMQPVRFSGDERRLYFNHTIGLGSALRSVSLDDPNDSFVIYDSTTPGALVVPTSQMSPDRSAFVGRALDGVGYVLRAAAGSTPIAFTTGTGGFVEAVALNHDASRAYYLRHPQNSLNNSLYAVDMSTPANATQIGVVASGLGVSSFKLAQNGARIAYATTDLVAPPGGGLVPGNSKLYLLTLASNSSSVPLQSSNAYHVDQVSQDDGVAFVRESGLGTYPRLHAFNLLDPTQLLRLDDATLDTGIAEFVELAAQQ